MNKESEKNTNEKEYYFSKDWFEIKQIESSIWALREPKHDENVISYYIKGQKKDILFDTGMGLANIKDALPFPNRNIQVILSHTHWDHMGGVTELDDVSVFNHPYETDRLRKGWNSEEMTGFTLENFFTEVPASFHSDTFSLSGIDKYTTLSDGERIDLGGLTAIVIHTPGHTPGGISLFIEETGCLFTGDTLYPGPEYLHMNESNPNDYFKSLERLNEQLKGNVNAIFPGHNITQTSVDLLTNHLLAAKGTFKPESIKDGQDVFNKFTEYKWSNFSFLLPRGYKLPIV